MRRRDLGTGVVSLVVWRLQTSWAQPRRPPGPVLFTSQEAARLRWSDAEWIPSAGRASLRTRSMAAGPRIVVQRPLVRETPEGPTLATVTPRAYSSSSRHAAPQWICHPCGCRPGKGSSLNR